MLFLRSGNDLDDDTPGLNAFLSAFPLIRRGILYF
jgi:hypothetical protein